ncbi:hypothetical protein MMC10_011084 [Thelotrema lepadinum]|nr:hypothetical protein [Thelotrema lepadinum]
MGPKNTPFNPYIDVATENKVNDMPFTSHLREIAASLKTNPPESPLAQSSFAKGLAQLDQLASKPPPASMLNDGGPVGLWILKSITGPDAECSICTYELGDSCVSCQAELAATGDIITQCDYTAGSCGHEFHTDCLVRWLGATGDYCPVCYQTKAFDELKTKIPPPQDVLHQHFRGPLKAEVPFPRPAVPFPVAPVPKVDLGRRCELSPSGGFTVPGAPLQGRNGPANLPWAYKSVQNKVPPVEKRDLGRRYGLGPSGGVEVPRGLWQGEPVPANSPWPLKYVKENPQSWPWAEGEKPTGVAGPKQAGRPGGGRPPVPLELPIRSRPVGGMPVKKEEQKVVKKEEQKHVKKEEQEPEKKAEPIWM